MLRQPRLIPSLLLGLAVATVIPACGSADTFEEDSPRRARVRAHSEPVTTNEGIVTTEAIDPRLANVPQRIKTRPFHGKLCLVLDAGRTWTLLEADSPTNFATFSLPGTGGIATMTAHWFGGGGGNVDANLRRWAHQFDVEDGDPILQSNITILGTQGAKVTRIQLVGNYTGETQTKGEKHTTRDDWAIDAAVIETRWGPIFLKTVGPRQTLSENIAWLDLLYPSIKVEPADDATPPPYLEFNRADENGENTETELTEENRVENGETGENTETHENGSEHKTHNDSDEWTEEVEVDQVSEETVVEETLENTGINGEAIENEEGPGNTIETESTETTGQVETHVNEAIETEIAVESIQPTEEVVEIEEFEEIEEVEPVETTETIVVTEFNEVVEWEDIEEDTGVDTEEEFEEIELEIDNVIEDPFDNGPDEVADPFENVHGDTTEVETETNEVIETLEETTGNGENNVTGENNGETTGTTETPVTENNVETVESTEETVETTEGSEEIDWDEIDWGEEEESGDGAETTETSGSNNG